MNTVALPVYPSFFARKCGLNNNLLSLISVILLCVMVFLAVDAFAQVCQSEQAALNRAQKAHMASGARLATAQLALSAAILTGNLVGIGVASVAVLALMASHDSTGSNLAAAYKAYYDCLAKHGGG